MHRGSVVFRDELKGMVNNRSTFNEIKLTNKAGQRTRNNSKLDKETDKWANQGEYDDEEDDRVASDNENDMDGNSDLSFEGFDDRKRVVTSHSDLDKDSPRGGEKESSSEKEAAEMSNKLENIDNLRKGSLPKFSFFKKS